MGREVKGEGRGGVVVKVWFFLGCVKVGVSVCDA